MQMPTGKEFRSSLLMALAIAALTAGIFALDLLTPLGWAEGFLYLIPLIVLSRSPQRHHLVGFTALCSGLITLGAILSSQPFPPPEGTPGQVVFERAAGISALWGMALFLRHRNQMDERLRITQTALEDHVRTRTVELQRTIDLLGKDLAEHKRAKENLARLAAIVESSDDAIIGETLDEIITDWNRGAEHLYGYRAPEVVGKPIALLIPSDRPDEETRIIERIKQGARIEHFETVHRRKDGERIDVSLTVSPIWDRTGRIVGISTIARDIRERRQAHDVLKLAYARLLELTIRLDSAQEEDRKHISREIHDELGQSLTALKLDLAWINKRLSAMGESALRSHLLEKVRAMSAVLDSTNRAVRKIATSLRPKVLDDLGLAAALKTQAGEFQSRTGVRCDVAIGPRVMAMQIDSARSTALFRITQELLTNVMRHAQASKVGIEFTEEAGMLILQVRDDGRGITEGDMANAASLGLVGIRERASRLGGDFTITGEPEKGTVAVVRIPMQKNG